jgi:hypothetical protein
MRGISVRLAALAACVIVGTAGAQSQSASARAAELAASFNKSKHSVKSKHGMRREKFKEVIVEPQVLRSPADYSGSYADEGLEAGLDLAIDSSGRGAGWGKDPAVDGHGSREFTLENVRVDGALLTATKKYHSGGTETFEAVFVTRSDREHPDSAPTQMVGIGVKLRHPVRLASSITVERFFLKRSD